MWQQISDDLKGAMNVIRSSEKCNERFKGMRYAETKRKQKELELLAIQNAQAGLTPEQREYANQKQREGIKYEVVFVKDGKEKPLSEMGTETDSGTTISGVMLLRSTLLEIHRKTEESNERRHQEQMAADERRHLELIQNMDRRHTELLAAQPNY